LRAEDVTVLGLEVQPSWTGEAVAGFLARSLGGLPRLNIAHFITDGGTKTVSADVLAIPLYSVAIGPEFVKQALLETPYKVVREWEQMRTCENRYAQPRRMEQELKSDAA